MASSATTLKQAREHVEREMIEQALKRNSGKITSAAAELGISRPTLYELMEKLGIAKEQRKLQTSTNIEILLNMQTSKILFRIVTLILAIFLITACSKEARKARLLGEADNYFKAGNYDKAKLAYLNVLRLDPQNALAFERIGAMWQDDGAPLRAAAFLKKASELDPKNVQNRIRLARCYVAIGRFDDATKGSTQSSRTSPGQWRRHYHCY